MHTLLKGLTVALVTSVGTAAMAGERLLVQEPDLLVVADRATACGEQVPVTIRAADVGFFTSDSNRLQGTVDGVRAMLGFECARIPGLTITGEAGAAEQVVFRGQAGDTTSWLIEGQTTGQAATSATGQTSGGPLSSGQASTAETGTAGSGRTIAGVALGMTVDQAMQAAEDEFGRRPEYQADRNFMQVAEGGCDFRFGAGTAPQPGWRCLEVAFTDTDPSRLRALGLAQVLDQDRRDTVEQRLVGQFGPPAKMIRGDGQSSVAEGYPFVFMAWDDVVSDSRGARLASLDTPMRKLEAYAVVRDGVTVVTIWNQDPAIAESGQPKYRLKF